MTKVICIDIKGLPDFFPPIFENEEYNVDGVSPNGNYALVERPQLCIIDNDRYYYNKERFIPCSEIDEKEFERNYNKQLV